jgi:hypothetical protein
MPYLGVEDQCGGTSITHKVSLPNSHILIHFKSQTQGSSYSASWSLGEYCLGDRDRRLLGTDGEPSGLRDLQTPIKQA